MRAVFPSRALVLLLGIGILDLAATVALRGQIEERNPLMAPLLASGGAPFAAVKAGTLLAAWAILARFERGTVRRACFLGSAAYVALLLLAFLA